jgi:aconitase B
LGKLTTVEEYSHNAQGIDTRAAQTYRYHNFNELPSFTTKATKATDRSLPLVQ